MKAAIAREAERFFQCSEIIEGDLDALAKRTKTLPEIRVAVQRQRAIAQAVKGVDSNSVIRDGGSRRGQI